MPPPVFPVKATAAMRCALAAQEEGKLVPFARECFEAYWSHGLDISLPHVLMNVCAAAIWTAGTSSNAAGRTRSRTACGPTRTS